jgi:hypothetical protein
MTRHLTYTGLYAGRTFCANGKRSSDTAVHYAYASDAAIALPDTCPDCRHAASCDDESCQPCATVTVAAIYPASTP